MDDGTAHVICDALLERDDSEKSDKSPDTQSQFFWMLVTLPQPEAHTFDVMAGHPRSLLLAGDLLVEVLTSAADGGRSIASKSRPLADSGAVVELEWGPRKRRTHGSGHHTRWNFRFPSDGSMVPVTGRVQVHPHEVLDGAEDFARLVAGRVGSPVSA